MQIDDVRTEHKILFFFLHLLSSVVRKLSIYTPHKIIDRRSFQMIGQLKEYNNALIG